MGWARSPPRQLQIRHERLCGYDDDNCVLYFKYSHMTKQEYITHTGCYQDRTRSTLLHDTINTSQT